jgi:hypothetical protein
VYPEKLSISEENMIQQFSRNSRIAAPLVIGALYGLTLRLVFESKLLQGALEIVSTSFLVVAPVCVGALAVFMAANGQQIGRRRAVAVAFTSMALFLCTMVVTLLEGAICIALMAPVYLTGAIIGGIVARGFVNRGKTSRSTVAAFALLPLLLGPLENTLPLAMSNQTVVSSIEIAAPPETVFDHLTQVRNIRPDELGLSFVHLIGLPKPAAADMSGEGPGAVRVSRWEKNVRFEEIITTWNRPYALHYRFHIPPGSIPRDALDRHVELGGEYFTVLDGGYDLSPTANGGTLLTLRTRFENRSRLKLYGDLWGKLVLYDFHRSILGLMRTRSEREVTRKS